MGWIQTSAKNFGEKTPHELIAVEVWEPAYFTGKFITPKGSGVETYRAHRTVYETAEEAVAVYEFKVRELNEVLG